MRGDSAGKAPLMGLLALLTLNGCAIQTCRMEVRPIEYLFSIGQLTPSNSELDLNASKGIKKRLKETISNKGRQTK